MSMRFGFFFFFFFFFFFTFYYSDTYIQTTPPTQYILSLAHTQIPIILSLSLPSLLIPTLTTRAYALHAMNFVFFSPLQEFTALADALRVLCVEICDDIALEKEGDSIANIFAPLLSTPESESAPSSVTVAEIPVVSTEKRVWSHTHTHHAHSYSLRAHT